MTAPADWWPAAAHRPVGHASQAHPFAAAPAGWVLHVQVGTGSPHGEFEASSGSSARFSHLWVAKDGRVEQYGPLSRIAWHAVQANARFWGVETEGMPGEPLTAAQIATLAAWHVWCGAPDRIAATPSDGGITCHYIGRGAWGGHSCPDPAPGGQGPRSHQRAAIIAAAQALRGGDDMPLSEQEWQRLDALIKANNAAVATEVETRFQVHDGNQLETRTKAIGDIQNLVEQIHAVVTSGVPASGGAAIDVQALAAALATALGPVLAGQFLDAMATRLVR